MVDFGIAKRVCVEPDAPALTQVGVVLGTVPYMSPEQAEGKAVDGRSDIFSLGSVLYEMVTGRRCFPRSDTMTSTLAAVLEGEPVPVPSIAEDVPPKLTEVIERCLRKNPVERYGRMDDVRTALEDVLRDLERDSPTRASKRKAGRRRPLLWSAGAALAIMAVVIVALWRPKPSYPEAALTAIPLTAYPGFESGATFSPDGEQVAFSWCEHEGSPTYLPEYVNVCSIYVKEIGVEPPFRLTDSRAKDVSPAWSPDGRWIAFVRLTSPKKFAAVLVPQRGGRERILYEQDVTGSPDMPLGGYLSWAPDSQSLVCSTPGRESWFLSLLAINTAEKRVLTDLRAGGPTLRRRSRRTVARFCSRVIADRTISTNCAFPGRSFPRDNQRRFHCRKSSILVRPGCRTGAVSYSPPRFLGRAGSGVCRRRARRHRKDFRLRRRSRTNRQSLVNVIVSRTPRIGGTSTSGAST